MQQYLEKGQKDLELRHQSIWSFVSVSTLPMRYDTQCVVIFFRVVSLPRRPTNHYFSGQNALSSSQARIF